MDTSAFFRIKKWGWPIALLAITLIALGLRYYYVMTAQVLQPVRGDAKVYYLYAWNLVHHGAFAKDILGSATIHPDSYRDPGYPFFLAIWMIALGTGGSWYNAVLLCQSLLGALTVTLATQLGKHWLSTRWTIASGLLIAVWPHSIAINGYLLSETMFSFLCALGLLLCAHACRNRSLSWAIAAGLIFGAAALTNAVLLPFGILVAAFLTWRKLVPLKTGVALLAGALLLPGAWAIRNTQIPSPAADSSSLGRALINLEQGSWPGYQSAWQDSFFGNASAQANAHAALRGFDDEYRLLRTSPLRGAEMMLRRFGQHPWCYATWYLLEKPYLLWTWNIQIGQGDIYIYRTINSPFQTYPPWIALEAICHTLNLPLLLLALASLFFTWTGKQCFAAAGMQGRTAAITTSCLLAFVTLVYTSLQAEPRYSIPFRPFEILLAITTLSAFTAWSQRHRLAQRRAPPPIPTSPSD